MAGIYIHVPFCRKACHYCDFHFSTNLTNVNAFIEAICSEFQLWSHQHKDTIIETIYFGGGTPSILDTKNVEKILNQLSENYNIKSVKEITFEINPDDIENIDYLEKLFDLGINRISLGIQSTDNHILQKLNRAHNAQQSFKALELIKKSNFNNFSIDFIYGLPFRTEGSFANELNEILEFEPSHLSAYILSIEENTFFGRQQQQKKWIEADEEMILTEHENLCEILEKKHIYQYEVSNFSKKGFESKHNQNYWNNIDYLGFGPGAHSYDSEKKTRRYNITNNAKYIKSIRQKYRFYGEEKLSTQNQFNEYIMTRLRTIEGIDFSEVIDKHNFDFQNTYQALLSKLFVENKILLTKEGFTLSQSGILFSDEIASDFFKI